MHNRLLRSPVAKRCLAVASAAGAAMLIAACGGSGTTVASTQSPGSQTTSSGGSSQVAAAVKATNAAVKTPNTLPSQPPLKSPPPKGKTFVWLSCELPACGELASGLSRATALVGWKLKVIQYNQADTSSLGPAFQEAIADKPVAIGLSGTPEALWASEIPQAQAAHIAIIPSYVGPTQLSSTVIGNIADGPELTEVGNTLANWFIDASGGKGDVAVLDLTSFPSLAAVSNQIISKVKSSCSSCHVTPVQATIQDVDGGTLDSSIVSAIQRDPSIHYFLSPGATLIDGLPVALKGAGLTSVKIGAAESDAQSLEDLKSGTMSALIGDAFQISAFQILDIALRHVEGMKINPYDGGFPQRLLLQNSSFTPAADFPPIGPYISQFKKLWKL